VASSRNVGNETRAARERLRLYNARQAVHTRKVSRRKRDNAVSIAAGILVVALATVAQLAYFTAGPGVPAAAPSASSEPDASETNIGDIPSPDLAEGRLWTGELVLNQVALGIELDGAAAPQAVASFVQSVSQEYYVGKSCHRLTNGGFFVLQCGSLDGSGNADPTFTFGPIENAPADDVYPAGTIAMARGGDNAYSNGRQFFVVYEDTVIASDAAGGYTVMGRVTSGLDELRASITDAGLTPEASENDGSPVVPTTITRVTVN
jgi:peptidyl-prolyl cis-trans isomerase B (cyclophilin B)